MINVLIVDDDQELLEMVCLMVRTNGMTAIAVNDGDGLFSSLESNQVDMVLMDIFLGNHDGRELVKQIRADSRYAHLPVLLYSAGSIDKESLKAPQTDFIQKPFDMQVLIGRIRNMAAMN